ncbi:MAG TPA: hypothetical protein VN455_03185, partial [Methanotrichaceae archaeon]|nr:hypothetical protein [Methanotrichaceae archaeon]
PSGCADKTLPIRVDAREDTANPDTTITESSTAAVGPTRAQSAPPRGTGQPQCTRAGIRYWESAMSTLRRTSAFAP